MDDNKKNLVVNFKAAVLGNCNVGKSNLLARFVDGSYNPNMIKATSGPEVSSYVFHPEDLKEGAQQIDANAKEIFARTTIRLSIFDLPGQQGLAEAVPMAMRNNDAAFICYDISDCESFESSAKWLHLLRQYSPNATVILVGCKCDLEEAREVSKSDADALARQLDIPFFETSAKANMNVEYTFRFVAQTLRQRWYAASRSTQSSQPNVKKVNLGNHNNHAGSSGEPQKKCRCG